MLNFPPGVVNVAHLLKCMVKLFLTSRWVCLLSCFVIGIGLVYEGFWFCPRKFSCSASFEPFSSNSFISTWTSVGLFPDWDDLKWLKHFPYDSPSLESATRRVCRWHTIRFLGKKTFHQSEIHLETWLNAKSEKEFWPYERSERRVNLESNLVLFKVYLMNTQVISWLSWDILSG